MKITRIYTGPDGQSHFEDFDLALSEAKFGSISDPISTNQVFFGEISEPREISWHNPPVPQYVIMLIGSMEIETSSGVKRTFQQGDILLAEDTHGQGHITRAASKGVRRYLVIPKI